MKRVAMIATALAALAASPAAACVPPPPGAETPPPPSEARIAELTFRQSSEIAEGVVLAVGDDDSVRFRVRHVYAGKLKPGAVLVLPRLTTPPCGGVEPPPLRKGAEGVIAFTIEPAAEFVPPEIVDRMIADKWIAPSARDRKRLQRVGTGSAPE